MSSPTVVLLGYGWVELGLWQYDKAQCIPADSKTQISNSGTNIDIFVKEFHQIQISNTFILSLLLDTHIKNKGFRMI